MAMDGEEDTVMGEAPRFPNSLPPHPQIGSHPTSAGTLNGRADPVLAQSPLAQSLRAPLPPRMPMPAQAIRETSSVADSQPMSPQGPARSVERHDDHTSDYETADSLVQENSDFEEEEEEPGLPLESLPSGLCYDIRMRYHCEVRPTTDVHPEDPRRIYYIYKELCRAGLVEDPEASIPLAARPLKRIHARDATRDEISLVHTPEHYEFVDSTKCTYALPLMGRSASNGIRHVRYRLDCARTHP